MRYHLFTGDDYYPQAGLGNYQESFDSEDEAIEAGRSYIDKKRTRFPDDWYYVIAEVSGHLAMLASGRRTDF